MTHLVRTHRLDGSVVTTEAGTSFDVLPADTERAWRDFELVLSVDSFGRTPLMWESLPQADKDKVAAYRQLLLDWPQHADFPDSSKRPVKPADYPEVPK